MHASTARPNPLAPLLAVLLAGACTPPDAPSAATTPTPAEGGDPAMAPAAADANAANEVAVHLQRSLELELQGDLAGAEVEAKASIAAGGGRDAIVQLAKLAILGQRYDEAATPLHTLVQADPDDAAAQYNLALVRHHQGDYNRARSGYLAALRSDARYADARYNLAVLCLAHGFADEARHHAAKFRAAFPQDPRGPQLEQRVGGTGAAGPAGATLSEPERPAPSPVAPPPAPAP